MKIEISKPCSQTNIWAQNALPRFNFKPRDPQFWKGLLKVREDFLRYGSFKIRDGSQTRFWEDTWVDSSPLKEQFPSLYSIANCPHVIVKTDMNQVSINVSFCRALTEDKWTAWLHLVAKIATVQLSNERDVFNWGLCMVNVCVHDKPKVPFL
jgi:hypothetical protein